MRESGPARGDGPLEQPPSDGQPGPADRGQPGITPPLGVPRHSVLAVCNSVWYGLMTRADQVEHNAAQAVHLPAWRRKTRGELRWPVSVTVVVAIVLQTLLPGQLSLQPLPGWLMPVLEGGLLVGLAISNPIRIEHRARFVRWASLVLIFVLTGANATSAVLLVRGILTGHAGSGAGPLLASGAAIWATNVIAFALWYWEFDRGGPVHRAHGTFQYLDFLFPQMTVNELVPRDWEPIFVDYLYLSFTNATAFSPTDVMPLARWAKLTMLVQSTVSLALAALVIARAINILPS
ncbi:MAG TPA: hypothetical protein VMH35_02730 [Streptosporangiaceae bacterium]|nr:hypothetical protein [Streptosporangiaceae bacterium]